MTTSKSKHKNAYKKYAILPFGIMFFQIFKKKNTRRILSFTSSFIVNKIGLKLQGTAYNLLWG